MTTTQWTDLHLVKLDNLIIDYLGDPEGIRNPVNWMKTRHPNH